jgi:hypothetical protein
MMGRGGRKNLNELVISRVRVKAPRRMQRGSREWIMLIECVSATGKRLPAFYIYAGTAHYMRARKKGVTPHNIKAAWATCGIHPFNKTRVTTNPQCALLIRAQSESSSPPLREGLRSQQKLPIIIEIENISATIPTTISEAQSLLSKMREIATREALRTYQLEAQLGIAQQELHQALTREKPTEKSRKVLSSARYITEGDLQTARHGQEEPILQPKRKRTQNAGGEPSVKRGRRKQQQVRDEDIIGAADSEVKRQVQALMAEDEDGVEEESEHERPLLRQISKNIVQTAGRQASGSSATAK